MRLSSALCALLVFGLAQRAVAYPSHWIGVFSSSCTSHPTSRHASHGAPSTDRNINFVAALQGTAQTKACPGTSYSLQLSWPNSRAYLVTASQGTFTTGNCPNRRSSDIQVRQVDLTLSLPCSASGSVVIQTTTAAGSSSAYQANTLSLPIDPACSACTVTDSPTPAPLPTASSLPPPVSSPLPSPSLSPSLEGLTSAQVSAHVGPSPSCGASDMGYDCTVVLGDITMHYTWGPSATPPSNPCTDGASPASPSQLQLAASSTGWLHMAAETRRQGYVSVAWAQTSAKMLPSDAILGGIEDGTGMGFVNTFKLRDFHDLPEADAFEESWAVGMSSYLAPPGRTFICYSRAAVLPTSLPNITSPGAQGAEQSGGGGAVGSLGRRVMRRLRTLEGALRGEGEGVGGAERRQMLAQPWGAPLNLTASQEMLWATNNRDTGSHVSAGGFIFNFGSGALETRVAVLDTIIMWHGILMLLSFLFFMPTGVIIARHRALFPKRLMFNKASWFWFHSASQWLAVACFAAGIGLAIHYFDNTGLPGVKTERDAHGALGYTLIALIALQVIAASTIRPSPEHPRRQLWTWAHRLSGLLIVLLAWANIGLGIWLNNASFGGGEENYVEWTIAAIVLAGAAVVLEVALTIYESKYASHSYGDKIDVGGMKEDGEVHHQGGLGPSRDGVLSAGGDSSQSTLHVFVNNSQERHGKGGVKPIGK